MLFRVKKATVQASLNGGNHEQSDRVALSQKQAAWKKLSKAWMYSLVLLIEEPKTNKQILSISFLFEGIHSLHYLTWSEQQFYREWETWQSTATILLLLSES